MIFVSDLIGKPVVDADGQQVGRVLDVIATQRGALPRPHVVAVVLKMAAGDTRTVSTSDITVLVGPAVVLSHTLPEIAEHEFPDAMWLQRDILDKEIIDTADARVVRVNNLELERVNGQLYLAAVNIGGLAILRRMSLDRAAERVLRLLGRTPQMARIAWDDVESLPGAKPLRGKKAGSTTDELPPADLAEIISDLNPVQSSQMVESLDVERLADTLEEVEPDFQASLVESLSDEKVADVLEEMAPDEAADLLAELPEDRSESLLKLMHSEEANDVRKLLAYPEDTAGGMMTTDFVTVPPTLNAEQAIDMLRKTARESETIYYVYVTDDDNHLLGVCSLQSLVLARPDALISEIMHDRVVSFGLQDSQDDLAQAVAKYNILAVPIVDEENRLHGIVTADDAIDKIIPTAWKKRLPRLYHGT